MTRRATPLLDPTGLGNDGFAATAGAVPSAIVGDDLLGIVVANPPPPPPAVGEPTVVWVHDGAGGAEPPPGATACTVDEALRWTSEGPPPWLHRRRLDGILVHYAADAPAAVRRAARGLRERVTPRDVAGLRDLAVAWGNPALVDALARLGAHRAPTFADLARALTRSDDPDAAHYARLCWALEHL